MGYRDEWTKTNTSLEWDKTTKWKTFSAKVGTVVPPLQRAAWEIPVMATGISLVALLLISIVSILIIRKRNEKKTLYEAPNNNKSKDDSNHDLV